MTIDFQRRFGGVGRLYGEVAWQKIQAAHVCVVGIGGVGSWAAEALARSSIGRITLIDLDMIAESNTNRQIHALGSAYGKAKVEAMAERILEINPDCQVKCIDDFLTAENLPELLQPDVNVVIDAIDQARVKTSMIVYCKQQRIPLIVAGAAGGQMDPTQVRVADLSQTVQDPLLAKVRANLRREHNFPRKGRFGVSAVYSTEALRHPDQANSCDSSGHNTGLNCAGFGSSVCVTSVFGMVSAARAIALITRY